MTPLGPIHVTPPTLFLSASHRAMSQTDAALQAELLTLTRTRDIAALIESSCDKMSVATGSIALHLLARSAQNMPKEEKQGLARLAWFGKMLMRLGGQLAGASESDAQGLSSILWAMALLDQADSPLLQGLVKRLLLLTQHGRASASQMVLTAQALSRLKLLGGPVGQALANLSLSRIADFHAAQLGTMARCLCIYLPMSLVDGADPTFLGSTAVKALDASA